MFDRFALWDVATLTLQPRKWLNGWMASSNVSDFWHVCCQEKLFSFQLNNLINCHPSQSTIAEIQNLKPTSQVANLSVIRILRVLLSGKILFLKSCLFCFSSFWLHLIIAIQVHCLGFWVEKIIIRQTKHTTCWELASLCVRLVAKDFLFFSINFCIEWKCLFL